MHLGLSNSATASESKLEVMAVGDGSRASTTIEEDTPVDSVKRAKRKLNRKILGLNGIQFSESEDSTWEPALHIASLKEELLNFVDIVSPSRAQPQYSEVCFASESCFLA